MTRRVARAAVLLLLSTLAYGAHGGGPLVVQADGTPFVWPTTSAIGYTTDDGPLSATVGEAAARSRIAAMFGVWQNVATASISFAREGFIEPVGAFNGGDVNNVQEFDAVEGDCANGNQSPITYDANGQIFVDLGIDETSVIGFAGPCSVNIAQGLILSGEAVMNGLFQDGNDANVPDLTVGEFDATFVHEFGHFAGLDHSQINVDCGFVNCGSAALAGLPTMFPFLVSDTQISPSTDDIAWLSKLYPASGGSGFDATHGHLTGTIYFSDGESQVQGVNVIARPVDTGGTPEDESVTKGVSNLSGFRFKARHGNPILADVPGLNPSFSGSVNPGFIGSFEIPVPAGDYVVEFESVDPAFDLDSGIGDILFPIPIPGLVPAPIPVTVAAGATTSVGDVVLVGTPPRFDQFEGP